MSKVTCEFGSEQLYDVVEFGATGERLGVVTSGAMFSGALSCARGFNASSRENVAVVLPTMEEPHESALIELELSDFCESRLEETDKTACLWDWLREGVDVEAVDLNELEATCHSIMRTTLAGIGEHVPPCHAIDNDGLILCARLSVSEQFAIWQELRLQF